MVAWYLGCGIFERGFARIRCPDCAARHLLAYSCKGRGLWPSCGARRAAPEVVRNVVAVAREVRTGHDTGGISLLVHFAAGIVDDRFVKRFWAGQRGVGRRFRIGE